MRCTRVGALTLTALAALAIALVPSVGARNKSATHIRDVELTTNMDGSGHYTGKVTSKSKHCVKGRHVKIIHLSDPPFPIGDAVTDEDGKWEIDGPKPPVGSPQQIKIVVAGEPGCKRAKEVYDIGEID